MFESGKNEKICMPGNVRMLLAFLVAMFFLKVSAQWGCTRQASLDEKLFRLNRLSMDLLEMEDRLEGILGILKGKTAGERLKAGEVVEKLEREETKLKQIHDQVLALEPLPGYQEKVSQFTIAALQTGQAIAAMRSFLFFQSASVGSEHLYYSLTSMGEETVSAARSTLDIFLGNATDPHSPEDWYGWLLLEYFESAKGYYPLYYWDLDQGVFDIEAGRINEALIYLRTNLQRTLKDIYVLEVPDFWGVSLQRLKELVECMVGQSFHLLELNWPIGRDEAEMVSMRYQLSSLVSDFFEALEARRLPRE